MTLKAALIGLGLLLALTGWLAFSTDKNYEYIPIETNQQAYPFIEAALAKVQRWKPYTMSMGNLLQFKEHVTDLSVLKNLGTYDHPHSRHILFKFDTGCGAVIDIQFGIDPWGRSTSIAPWEDLCATKTN